VHISAPLRIAIIVFPPLAFWLAGWFDTRVDDRRPLMFAVLMVAIFWGMAAVEPLMAFFPALGRHIHRQVYEEWEGKYYKYGLTHLRAYFDGDDAWFNAEDVLSVLDKKPEKWRDSRFTPAEYGLIPGRKEKGFTPAGVVKLTQLSTHPEAARFRLWFERAVIFTLERKKASSEISAGN
jgi:hypothetical protein